MSGQGYGYQPQAGGNPFMPNYLGGRKQALGAQPQPQPLGAQPQPPWSGLGQMGANGQFSVQPGQMISAFTGSGAQSATGGGVANTNSQQQQFTPFTGAPQVGSSTGRPPMAPAGAAIQQPDSTALSQPGQTQGGDWRSFNFANPTTGFQQNFNTLQQQNPDAAFAYLSSGYGGADAWNQFRNAYGPNAGAIYNQYAQFTPGSAQAQGLGLTNPSVTAQTFDPSKYSGLTMTPEMQKQLDPTAFSAANPFQYGKGLFG